MARDTKLSEDAPSESDRLRVVAALKASAAAGTISPDELESRTEEVFRARTRSGLAGVAGGIPASPATAESLAVIWLTPPAPRPTRSTLQRQVLQAAIFLAFWLVVCALTHSSALWYLVTIAGSALGFAFRLARAERKRLRAAVRPRVNLPL